MIVEINGSGTGPGIRRFGSDSSWGIASWCEPYPFRIFRPLLNAPPSLNSPPPVVLRRLYGGEVTTTLIVPLGIRDINSKQSPTHSWLSVEAGEWFNSTSNGICDACMTDGLGLYACSFS